MNKTTSKKLLASIRKQISDHSKAIIELRKVEQTLADELNGSVQSCLLSVACREFNIPTQTLHSWVRRGEVSAVKQGKRLLVNRGQIEDLAIQKGYYYE